MWHLSGIYYSMGTVRFQDGRVVSLPGWRYNLGMGFELQSSAPQEKAVRYYHPQENAARGGLPVHKIEFRESGEKIGYATFEYHNDPFPFYYVSMVFVDKPFRGRGFGGEILREINNHLDSTGKAGLLSNGVNRKNPARQMYENYGWVPVPHKPDWFAYNLPEGIDSGRIDKALYSLEKPAPN
jgi:GNAT superfamily N-acetyltransferase